MLETRKFCNSFGNAARYLATSQQRPEWEGAIPYTNLEDHCVELAVLFPQVKQNSCPLKFSHSSVKLSLKWIAMKDMVTLMI
jgi:hypothetical protein